MAAGRRSQATPELHADLPDPPTTSTGDDEDPHFRALQAEVRALAAVGHTTQDQLGAVLAILTAQQQQHPPQQQAHHAALEATLLQKLQEEQAGA